MGLTQANGGLVGGKFPNHVGNAQITANIGELAASVAHDFNNILSIVEAYAALIVSNPGKPKEVIEDAVIRETVETGAMLTRQLLALARKTAAKLESTDINDLLQRMIKLFTPMFPTTIVIAEDLDARVPEIMFDSGLIYRAILNLCINGGCNAGGRQDSFANSIGPSALLRERLILAEAGHYVYISVADTGVGMEADVRDRIFESYSPQRNRAEGPAWPHNSLQNPR